ncbi:MAG: hypothetical protein QM786_17675 [Breznakibacter sp.]
MDSIGDFLYLLLMIGAVIVSVIKKGNKEKQAAPPPKPPQRDLKDLFPEMGNWMDDEEEEKAPVTEQRPTKIEVVPSAKPVSWAQPVQKTPVFTYDAPEIAQPGRAVGKSSPMQLHEDEENISLFDTEPFDLRKAVIYSEIMKRPTW